MEQVDDVRIKVRFTNAKSFGELREQAARETDLVYAMRTCWWKFGRPIYSIPGDKYGLPCDPRRSPLLEMTNPLGFIKAAEDNPTHYGRHGLRAFAAAYHGNVVAIETGHPTSLNTWDEYNAVIDAYDAQWAGVNTIVAKIEELKKREAQILLQKSGAGKASQADGGAPAAV